MSYFSVLSGCAYILVCKIIIGYCFDLDINDQTISLQASVHMVFFLFCFMLAVVKPALLNIFNLVSLHIDLISKECVHITGTHVTDNSYFNNCCQIIIFSKGTTYL